MKKEERREKREEGRGKRKTEFIALVSVFSLWSSARGYPNLK
jgi:hypothetical protein